MKKFAALAAVVLLLAIIFGAPYYAGMRIEKALIEHASPDASYELFSIDSISITRGIFSSDVEWGVSIPTVSAATVQDSPEDGGEAVETMEEGEVNFTLKAHITHGPFAFPGEFHSLESSSFGWGVVDTELFLPDFSETAPIYVSRSIATFGGLIEGEGLSDAGSFKDEEAKSLFAWGDFTNTYSTNFEGNSVSYKGVLQNLKIEDEAAKLLISDVAFDGVFAEYPPKGSFEIKVASMGIVDESGETTMKGFAFKVDTDTEGEMVSSTGNLHLDEVVADGKRSGPLGGTISLKRVSLEAYKMLNELGERVSELGPDADPDAVQTVMMGEMMRIVPIILEGGPVIEVKDVFAKSPLGDIEGGAVVSFEPDGSVNIFDQQDLLSKVRGDMAVTAIIPEGANSPLAQKAEELKEMGLVVFEEGKYIIRANFDGVRLTVNGNTLWEGPPPMKHEMAE